jgi:hypothetical protein
MVRLPKITSIPKDTIRYSALKLFTELAMAAFMVWKPCNSSY